MPHCAKISRAKAMNEDYRAGESLNQMQINHDADAMGQAGQRFCATDTMGSVMSKTQFLASIRDKSPSSQSKFPMT